MTDTYYIIEKIQIREVYEMENVIEWMEFGDLDLSRAIIDPYVIEIPLRDGSGEVAISVESKSAFLFQDDWETPMDTANVQASVMCGEDVDAVFTYLGVM